MGLGTIGLELVFIPISAITGAAVLLWLQTKYRRVKILHGLQQEIKDNIHTAGEAGLRIFKTEDQNVIRRFTFTDDIFRVARNQTPILYSQLVEGLSPVSDAYSDIAYLRDLDRINPGDDARVSLLKFLEHLEDELIKAGERVEEIQEESWSYRIYSRLFLSEIHQGRYQAIEFTEDGTKETVWRPSGQTVNEKREQDSQKRQK
jgi:hypothetical protein